MLVTQTIVPLAATEQGISPHVQPMQQHQQQMAGVQQQQQQQQPQVGTWWWSENPTYDINCPGLYLVKDLGLAFGFQFGFS